MRKAISFVFPVFLATILLASCAVTPISRGDSVSLKGNDGLAAVEFTMPEPIENVSIVPDNSKGDKLLIDNVPKGESIYLFVVPAGKYCLHKFISMSKATDYHSVGHAGPCFQVAAGKLSYSGDIGPYSIYGQFVMLAHKDPAKFHKLLRKEYPGIAAQFLPAK